jgi:periplasmic divalent cation tolerance protein
MPEASFQVVLVTVGKREEAESLAETLVSERLAACVNIIPHCRSYYRWEGKLSRDDELLLFVKSKQSLFAVLRDRIAELHSYDVPEIIALDIQNGSRAYLDFLADNLES